MKVSTKTRQDGEWKEDHFPNTPTVLKTPWLASVSPRKNSSWKETGPLESMEMGLG